MLKKFLKAKPEVVSALIFVNDPHRVEIIYEKLLEMGFIAAPLHGESSKDDRKVIYNDIDSIVLFIFISYFLYYIFLLYLDFRIFYFYISFFTFFFYNLLYISILHSHVIFLIHFFVSYMSFLFIITS